MDYSNSKDGIAGILMGYKHVAIAHNWWEVRTEVWVQTVAKIKQYGQRSKASYKQGLGTCVVVGFRLNATVKLHSDTAAGLK